MHLNSNTKSSRKAKNLPQFSIPSRKKPLLDLLEIQRKSFFDLLEHGIPYELAKTSIFRETTKNSTFTHELELKFNPETYKFVSPHCTPKQAILNGKTYACKVYVQATLVIRSPYIEDVTQTHEVTLNNEKFLKTSESKLYQGGTNANFSDVPIKIRIPRFHMREKFGKYSSLPLKGHAALRLPTIVSTMKQMTSPILSTLLFVHTPLAKEPLLFIPRRGKKDKRGSFARGVSKSLASFRVLPTDRKDKKGAKQTYTSKISDVSAYPLLLKSSKKVSTTSSIYFASFQRKRREINRRCTLFPIHKKDKKEARRGKEHLDMKAPFDTRVPLLFTNAKQQPINLFVPKDPKDPKDPKKKTDIENLDLRNLYPLLLIPRRGKKDKRDSFGREAYHSVAKHVAYPSEERVSCASYPKERQQEVSTNKMLKSVCGTELLRISNLHTNPDGMNVQIPHLLIVDPFKSKRVKKKEDNLGIDEGVASHKRAHLINANNAKQDTDVQIFRPWIFLGELPLMTKRGHFILNGSPRVIVNQIARCPGIYFQEKRRGVGFEQEIRVSADLIPQRGPWLRVQSDWEGRFWARLKQEGRVKYATLYEAFQEYEKEYNAPLVCLVNSSSSTFSKSETVSFQERKTKEDRQKKALIRLFKNTSRYSLGKLGRFRVNQRVHSYSSLPLSESIRLRQNFSFSHMNTFLKDSLKKLPYNIFYLTKDQNVAMQIDFDPYAMLSKEINPLLFFFPKEKTDIKNFLCEATLSNASPLAYSTASCAYPFRGMQIEDVKALKGYAKQRVWGMQIEGYPPKGFDIFDLHTPKGVSTRSREETHHLHTMHIPKGICNKGLAKQSTRSNPLLRTREKKSTEWRMKILTFHSLFRNLFSFRVYFRKPTRELNTFKQDLPRNSFKGFHTKISEEFYTLYKDSTFQFFFPTHRCLIPFFPRAYPYSLKENFHKRYVWNPLLIDSYLLSFWKIPYESPLVSSPSALIVGQRKSNLIKSIVWEKCINKIRKEKNTGKNVKKFIEKSVSKLNGSPYSHLSFSYASPLAYSTASSAYPFRGMQIEDVKALKGYAKQGVWKNSIGGIKKEKTSVFDDLNQNYLLMAKDIDAIHTCLERLLEGQGFTDDIDHLKNRFIRTSGKLLQQQFELGLHRLNEVIMPLLGNLLQGHLESIKEGKRKKQNSNIPLVPLSVRSNPHTQRVTFFPSEKKNTKQIEELRFVNIENLHSYASPFPKEPLSATQAFGCAKQPLLLVRSKSKMSKPLLSFSATQAHCFLCEANRRCQSPLGVRGIRRIRGAREAGGYFPIHRKEAQQIKDLLLMQSKSKNCYAPTNEQKRKGEWEYKYNNGDFGMESGILAEIAPFRWLRTSKPINSAFREFFGSNPLSQYMDQTNPLAEITHKRRLSSMGPGGIKRETAGMEVRGIHPTHYGRVCPIETPEGKNAGLVNSPTVYGRVGNYGFLETPLYQVIENQVQMKRWAFFSAQQEENEKSSLATCDTGLLEFNILNHVPIPVQTANNPLAHFQQVERNRVGYRALSPVQAISIATALIPFLEHDDANRALMGSNMQRQAIPLLLPERPIVGTGFEPLVMVESGQAVQATKLGCVSRVNAKTIVVHTIHSMGKAISQNSLRNPIDNNAMGVRSKTEKLASMQIKLNPCFFFTLLCFLPSDRKASIHRKFAYPLPATQAFSYSLPPASCAYPFRGMQIEDVKEGYEVCKRVCEAEHKMHICKKQPPASCAPLIVRSKPKMSKLFRGMQIEYVKAPLILFYPFRGINYASLLGYKKQGVWDKEIKQIENVSAFLSTGRKQNILEGRYGGRLHLCSSHNTFLLQPIKQDLQLYQRSNQETCLNHRPMVKEGDWIQKGDFLADSSASDLGDLALGKNVLVAYMPWEGYNFEDAIVISDRLVSDDIYTSLHIERYEIKINKNSQGKERITNRVPGTFHSLKHLDNFGIARTSSWVQPGDILVGKVVELKRPLSPYERLAWELASRLSPTSPEREKWLNKVWLEDISLRLPSGVSGRVINSQIVSTEWSDKEQVAYPQEVHIYLAIKRKIQIGDKLAGRHGNKGIVSAILPQQDMPYVGDGSCIDMVLNPLGVPSRMNLGQIFECLLGLAGSQLGCNFKITPFDEIAGGEASRSLVFLKLYQCRLMYKQQWLFTPTFPGKSQLFDGRTGEPFENWVTVGQAYMLKLIHMVDHKIHARSTGPYSLFTRQPVRGRSRRGGQRLGEMEVWAVEGFGAAYTLQEFLTIKSDDLKARTALQKGFYKQNDVTFGKVHISPGNPEAFKVLVSELQALCLRIQM